MTIRWIAVALISIAVAGSAAVAAAAPAAASTGPAFGAHVAACATAGMFSGEHNPGMHQGLAGWDGSR